MENFTVLCEIQFLWMCYMFKWKINMEIIEEEQISIFLKTKVIELRDTFKIFISNCHCERN